MMHDSTSNDIPAMGDFQPPVWAEPAHTSYTGNENSPVVTYARELSADCFTAVIFQTVVAMNGVVDIGPVKVTINWHESAAPLLREPHALLALSDAMSNMAAHVRQANAAFEQVIADSEEGDK